MCDNGCDSGLLQVAYSCEGGWRLNELRLATAHHLLQCGSRHLVLRTSANPPPQYWSLNSSSPMIDEPRLQGHFLELGGSATGSQRALRGGCVVPAPLLAAPPLGSSAWSARQTPAARMDSHHSRCHSRCRSPSLQRKWLVQQPRADQSLTRHPLRELTQRPPAGASMCSGRSMSSHACSGPIAQGRNLTLQDER